MDETRRLDLPDGVTLFWQAWRPPGHDARRVLVLLHGLASNHTRWSEFTELTTLKQDWVILRPDLRGHGASFTRNPTNLEFWIEDLVRLLDAEGVKQVVLAGHSLGAQVALYFAVRYPERTEGLILIDPVHRSALRGRLRLLAWLAPWLRLLARLVRVANKVGLRRRHIPPRDLRVLDKNTRAALAKSGVNSEIVRRYTSSRADIKYIPLANYLQDLAEVTRPLPPAVDVHACTLLLLSQGVTFTDLSAMRTWAASLPCARVLIIDAYHWPLTERPLDVRHAIEKFCAEPERVCSV